jgi:hypothetical protein
MFKMIAKKHISQKKNYYDLLKKYVETEWYINT